jgi:glycine hydroxymethyltransferase
MAVYMGFLRPGDIILGMELSHGGHLTHGGKASFSGQIFRSVTYGLHPKTQRIDFDQVKRLARDHKPKLIIAGASAYPRSIDFIRFREIASDHGAYLMADMAHIAGLVAADLHPSPIHVAHFVTSTTHKTLRGPRGGLILSEARYGNSLDRALFPGTQGGPLMHIIAAKAVALEEALKPGFKEYQQRVIRNAEVLAEALLEAGFDLVTGGTDNHLILVDLTPWGITGQAAETALGRAGIVVNKNTVPFDRRGPQVTSGLRLGTPALTTRGMNEKEMALVAGLITEVLRDPDSGDVIQRVRSRVSELCLNFPIYDYMLTEEDP